MSFSDSIPDVSGSRKETSPTVDFTTRLLLSGIVKLKRDDLGVAMRTGEEEIEHLTEPRDGGERLLERSAGEERAEEAAMGEKLEMFLEEEEGEAKDVYY